jgi:hypothetical protein
VPKDYGRGVKREEAYIMELHYAGKSKDITK